MENNIAGDEYSDHLTVGATLRDGQIKIDKFLNHGGFGITYLAMDQLRGIVVLKECYPATICHRNRDASVSVRNEKHLTHLENAVSKFIEEAGQLAQLNHPNIVKIHEVFQENNTAYMVIDYVEGLDLQQIIEFSPQTLTPEFNMTVLTRLLSAIQTVHQKGILHRDISPDNVLVSKDGQPILIDFGAAREDIAKQSRVLSTLNVVKDGYSPQEFYVSGSTQNESSDLYSLAATFYHCISGEMPPNSPVRLAALAEIKPNPYIPLQGRFDGYPPNALAAIDKALKVIPADRLQSAKQWLDALDPEAPPLNTNAKGGGLLTMRNGMVALLALSVVSLLGLGLHFKSSPKTIDQAAQYKIEQPSKDSEASVVEKTQLAANTIAAQETADKLAKQQAKEKAEAQAAQKVAEELAAKKAQEAAQALAKQQAKAKAEALAAQKVADALAAQQSQAEADALAKQEAQEQAVIAQVKAAQEAKAAIEPKPVALNYKVGEWEVDLPVLLGMTFDEELGRAVPIITAVFQAVGGRKDADWMKTGVKLHSLNGSPFPPSEFVSAFIKQYFSKNIPNNVQTTVQVSTGNGAPVKNMDWNVSFRKALTLTSGVVLNQKKTDDQWVLVVASVPTTVTEDLKVGDVLIRDLSSQLKLNSTASFELVAQNAALQGFNFADVELRRDGQVKQTRIGF